MNKLLSIRQGSAKTTAMKVAAAGSHRLLLDVLRDGEAIYKAIYASKRNDDGLITVMVGLYSLDEKLLIQRHQQPTHADTLSTERMNIMYTELLSLCVKDYERAAMVAECVHVWEHKAMQNGWIAVNEAVLADGTHILPHGEEFPNVLVNGDAVAILQRTGIVVSTLDGEVASVITSDNIDELKEWMF